MTACPAGVNYAALFEHARAEVEERRLLDSPKRKLIRWFTVKWLFMDLSRLLLLGRLTIQVDAQRVRWHFGFLGWPRWSVALADIAHVEATQLRWWEGQGIRFTFDGRLYNVASGGAVRLTLHDGKRIRLGSDEPERLAAWIGHRIGSG